jgi:DNA-binding GntR family transcriptional regulator
MSVYAKLREAIVTGDLGPGHPLVEATLAGTYGVSRTPIREALTRLEQDGLIVRADRGLLVRENSPEEILDLYDTRVVLEVRVAQVAAQRRTDLDLGTMRKAQAYLDKVSTGKPDFEEAAVANRAFHRSVWNAARSESLLDLLKRLDAHLGRYPVTTLSAPGRLPQANTQHHELIAAIADRDEQLAGAIASQHFLAARDIRLRLWSE